MVVSPSVRPYHPCPIYHLHHHLMLPLHQLYPPLVRRWNQSLTVVSQSPYHVIHCNIYSRPPKDGRFSSIFFPTLPSVPNDHVTVQGRTVNFIVFLVRFIIILISVRRLLDNYLSNGKVFYFLFENIYMY